MDPRVVASPDGAHLAVLRDHKLSLFALDSGRRVGAAEVTGTELAFAGNNLVVHAQGPHASLITVLTLPSLAVSSSHELGAPTRLMAAASAYALLDRGDQALMVHCGRAAAVAALRPPAAFTHAVGLEGPQFITFGPRGAELWDAASRRPEARLRLELPAETVAIGVTNRHALLWAQTEQPCLHLARISDGRVSTLWLDAPPRNVRSHPVAAWVVADVGGRALALNLAIGDSVPLDPGGAAIVAVAPRRDRDTGAVVVFLDGDALELRLLGGEARPMPRREGDSEGEAMAEPEVPAAAPEAAEGARGDAPLPAAAARGASLRERLGQRSGAGERAIPPPQVVPSTSPATGLTERLGARTRSIGAAIAGIPSADVRAAHGAQAAPLPAADLPINDVELHADSLAPLSESVVVEASSAARVAPPATPGALRAALPTPAPGAAVARPAAAARTWRDELVAWARSARGPAPTLDGSPLRALHLRLDLPPSAWPIACALYGRWLLGGGARGVASAKLATLAGGDWREALGAGALGGDGLVEWRHGRACLVDEVGDFLDERPPAVLELVGEAPRRPPLPGFGRLDGASVADARVHAERLAGDVGQVALYAGALAARELASARLAAWLRGLTLFVVGDPGPLALRYDEAVIAVAPAS